MLLTLVAIIGADFYTWIGGHLGSLGEWDYLSTADVPLSLLQKAISDVCWSPFNATMFGFVSQGRVEIWDLHHS